MPSEISLVETITISPPGVSVSALSFGIKAVWDTGVFLERFDAIMIKYWKGV